MPKTAALWDSCVIIDAIDQTPGRYKFIAPLMSAAERGDLLVVVSMASLVEVMYARQHEEAGVDSDDLIERWFDNSFVVKRNADRAVCSRARLLRRQFEGLTPIDSIILATALVHQVETVLTYDNNSKQGRAPMLSLDGKIGDPPLHICRPEEMKGQSEMALNSGVKE